jgi:hypothetical protein
LPPLFSARNLTLTVLVPIRLPFRFRSGEGGRASRSSFGQDGGLLIVPLSVHAVPHLDLFRRKEPHTREIRNGLAVSTSLGTSMSVYVVCQSLH